LQGLVRASLTLVAGGALAQALPLLLGPLLTRLFSPADFGHYHLFAAVAANLAVVACARYEFAPAAGGRCGRGPGPAGAGAAHRGPGDGGQRGGRGRLVGLEPRALGGLAAAGGGQRRCGVAGHAVGHARAALQRPGRVPGAAVRRRGPGPGGRGGAGLGRDGLVVAPIAATLLATLALRLPLGNAGLRWDTLAAVARRHRQFPLLNTPHAFLGALQDTASVA
jgi:hypothetical protein